MIELLIGAAFFATAGWVGALLSHVVCESKGSAPDGPPQHSPPTLLLVLACAAIGATLIAHNLPSWQLAAFAAVCVALVACWCSDAQYGVVPDVFTLVPIGLFLAISIWSHQWWYIYSGLIPVVPLAGAALFTKGYGLGWGDVKLAALGVLVVGAPSAVIAFTAACVIAVLVNRLGNTQPGPIAFAPYLVAAIGIAIPIGMIV